MEDFGVSIGDWNVWAVSGIEFYDQHENLVLEYELYLRRKGKYYFRRHNHKFNVTLNEPFDVLDVEKYGTMFKCEFNFE